MPTVHSFHEALVAGRGGVCAALLRPALRLASWGYRGGVAVRNWRFDRGAAARVAAPVISVGNITTGGTGKTPLVIHLAQTLRTRGMRPGVVSRGYASAGRGVRAVGPQDDPLLAGDEPVLIAQRAGVPVWVGADRVAAGRALLARHPDRDVLIADDGLQHYRLARDVEIAVIDEHGAGNGWLIPAGPLREPPGRLERVDAIVLNGARWPDAARERITAARFSMSMAGDRFFRLGEPGLTCDARRLRGLRLHAVAGIGQPQRFFDSLARLGLAFVAHPFPDHHRYLAAELAFDGCDAILMTEKDAVKCARLGLGQIWVLPVDAVVRPDLAEFVMERIDGREAARHPGLPAVQGAARIPQDAI